jgi:hypothetical protein
VTDDTPPPFKLSMRIAQMEFTAEGQPESVFKALGCYLNVVNAAFAAGNNAISALQTHHKGEPTH